MHDRTALPHEGDLQMTKLVTGIIAIVALCSLSACAPAANSSSDDRPPVSARKALGNRFSEPIKPIPQRVELDPEKVRLGEKLFHDPRLSHDNSVSCSTCHDLSQGGVDKLVHSVGINGSEGELNAPTVFNSSF